jgi:hypothetical protein
MRWTGVSLPNAKRRRIPGHMLRLYPALCASLLVGINAYKSAGPKDWPSCEKKPPARTNTAARRG